MHKHFGKALLLVLCFLLVFGFWPRFSGVRAQGTAHGVKLTWTAGTGDTAYNVYRATVSGGPYTSIATGVLVTTYQDTTGTQGTKYFYVVTGTAPGMLESVNSNEASATFLFQAAAPGSLAATNN